jgi:hypothetical protein
MGHLTMAPEERHPADRAAGQRAATAEDPAAAVPYRGHAGKLPGQLPEVAEHPLFSEGYRHGYEAGYRDHADAERRAELEEAPARLERHEEPPPPPAHRFDATVSADQLGPGAVIERELSARTGDTFTSVVPCCGRGVTLRLENRRHEVSAACCGCGILYRAGLRDEDDGLDDRWDEPFYLVVFEVIDLGLATARHRKGKQREGRPTAPEPRPSARKPPGRARGQDRPAHPGGLW